MDCKTTISRLLAAAVIAAAGAAGAGEFVPQRDAKTGRIFALRPVSVSVESRRGGGLGLGEAQARSNAESFIAGNAALLSLRDPASDLQFQFADIDARGGTHVRYRQISGDVPVLGGGLTVHLGPGGDVTYVTVNIVEDVPFNVTPLLTEAEALARAVVQADRDIQFGETAAWDVIPVPNGVGAPSPPSLEDPLEVLRPGMNLSVPGGRTARRDPLDGWPDLRPTASAAELVIVAPGLVNPAESSSTYLAWRVPVRDAVNPAAFAVEYFVDAHSGRVVYQQNLIENISRRIYDVASAPGDGTARLDYLVTNPAFPTPLNQYTFGRSEGQPMRGSHPGPDPNWAVTRTDMGPTPVTLPYLGSNEVDRLYDLLGQMHDFTLEKFGLNGANNLGGTADSATSGVVHADNINALWCPSGAGYDHGSLMLYFCLGAVAPDIVGHEYAHAIAHSVVTGGMYVNSQTGSLNEAFSDVVGEAFESYSTGMLDWKVGTGNFWGWFRHLASPWNMAYGYDPATGKYLLYPDRFFSPRVYCSYEDNWGIHYNSTVISHAFYVAATGDKSNCDVTAIGLDAASGVMFHAFKYYISTFTGFNEAYYAFLQACADLHGVGSDTYLSFERALQSTQMEQVGGTCYKSDPGIACTVRNAWAPIAVHADGTPATVFGPQSPIWVKGRGIPGRTVRACVKYAQPSRAHNVEITRSPLEASAIVGADSTFMALLVATPGDFTLPIAAFDILIDGNRDYTWEAWADTYCTFEVVAATGVDALAPRFAMGVASPNPAEGDLSLKYELGRAGNVRVTVYDVRGHLIAEPESGWHEPGPQTAVWNGRTAAGRRVAAGVYFLRVMVDGQDEGMRKVMVLR